MKTKMIVGAVVVGAVLSLYGTNGLADVKSVGDAICTVSDSVAMSNGIALVDYVLKPETESYIRCQIALPPREKWNGEFWGVGNSSFGGVLPNTYGLSAAMDAAVATTDLGTSAYVSRVGRKKDVPPAVMRDYAWRATHLMTVYGKRIVKAFYAREVPSEIYPQLWREMNLTLPIPPYPFMCYQDDGGNWKTKRYPDGMVRRPDPAYMPCATRVSRVKNH